MLKVSIITVVYNGEKTIESTIQSVLSQNYKNVEYIIIDGGSKDGTDIIINKYKDDISYYLSEKDSGIYDAMNKGLALAHGDIIGFLNSDDIYPDIDTISSIVENFKDNDVDLIYGDILYVSKENVNKIIRYWKSLPHYNLFFYHGHQIPHPSVFIKKEVFTQYGTFNTTLKIAADYELILRFVQRFNISTLHVAKVLVKMKIGGESNKSIFNIIKGNKEIYMSWKINGLKFNPLIFFIKPFTKLYQIFLSKVYNNK